MVSGDAGLGAAEHKFQSLLLKQNCVGILWNRPVDPSHIPKSFSKKVAAKIFIHQGVTKPLSFGPVWAESK